MRVPARLKDSVLGQNTLFMLGGHLSRAAIQVVYFIFIARALGSADYGLFVATTALAAVLAPFASLGAGAVLIMKVARDPSTFGRYWGNGIYLTLGSGVVLTAVVLLLSSVVLPEIDLKLVLCIAVSDLIFARLLDLSGQAFTAFEKLGRPAQFMVLISSLRLVAIVFLYFGVTDATPLQWGLLYLLTSALSGVYAVWVVCRHIGPPRRQFQDLRTDLKMGSYFAVGLSAQTVYNDIDKTMLASLGNPIAAGIYAAAYRIIDVAFKPIVSLLWSMYARFFRHGAGGVRASRSLALRFLPGSILYGFVAAAVLFVSAPLLPVFIGSGFSNSIEALRWLSPLPLIKSVHFFAADALTGAGKQGIRTVVQIILALVNIGLNFLLIPRYSWRGSAWAALITDSLLAVTLWGLLNHFSKHESDKPATGDPIPPSVSPLGTTGDV